MATVFSLSRQVTGGCRRCVRDLAKRFCHATMMLLHHASSISKRKRKPLRRNGSLSFSLTLFPISCMSVSESSDDSECSITACTVSEREGASVRRKGRLRWQKKQRKKTADETCIDSATQAAPHTHPCRSCFSLHLSPRRLERHHLSPGRATAAAKKI